MIKSFIKKILSFFNYSLVSSKTYDTFPPEASEDDKHILELVADYTMTTPERIWALISAVRYVIDYIDGDFVECGVWRGGSAMAMAYTLMNITRSMPTIWLYDTFSGMTQPSKSDTEIHTGKTAQNLLLSEKLKGINERNIWCYATLDDVKSNIRLTGFPDSKIRFIQGDVCDTLPNNLPEKISILRLDTDWYESTRIELELLYPKLQSGGVCIIDDYGYWSGSKKAVDEYFANNNQKILLHCIDKTSRMFIKP